MIHRFLAWLRGPRDLLAPLVRCEVVILYDANLVWSVSYTNANFTPAEREQIMAGIFRAMGHIGKEWGMELKFGPGPEPPA